MRTFIAIELGNEVKNVLAAAQEQAAALCRKGNYTPKENFHLTLHFLGEVTTETAGMSYPFSLRLDRIGFFPRGREGILWAGVEKSDALFRLFRNLETCLGRQGFGREKKGLRPHITLGREVEPYRHFSDVQKKVSLEAAEIPVTSISLMESVRMGRKLIYRPLVVQRLKDKRVSR